MQVSGLVSPRRLSVDAIAALESGNVNELLRIERGEFGGWSVMMADDADDTDDDDDDDAGSGGSGSGDTDDKDDDDSSDDDGDSDSDEEQERLRKRMKAADKRAAAAEKELQKIRDKDKSELERAQGQVEELNGTVTTLQSEVSQLRLQNAFLTANKHSWHNSDIALSLANSNKYLDEVMDDDGEVDKKALAKALDRLAKEHPYLVSTGKADDHDDDDLPDSGEPAGGRSDNGKDDKSKKEQLRKRFPVLNR